MITIGAHFSAIVQDHVNKEQAGYAYESARSCIFSLVKTIRPARVHIPNYICGVVSDAVKAAGAEVVNYAINRNFAPEFKFSLDSNEIVLLVNYFGLTGPIVKRTIEDFSPSQVIVDCSQAYFQSAFGCMATVFSARKFLPVADGGFISTEIVLPIEESNDEASIERYGYLLKRVVGEPEMSRSLYLAAEQSLNIFCLRGMSTFSKKIINSIDQDYIIKKRQQNYRELSILSKFNKLDLSAEGQVPLCYPLMIDNAALIKEELIKRRVFTPNYWSGINPKNDFEFSLLNNTIFLPVDHRYGPDHMQYIIDVVANQIDIGV